MLLEGSVHECRQDLIVAKLCRLIALDADRQALVFERTQDFPRAVRCRMIDHEHLVRIRQRVAHEAFDDVGAVRDQRYSDDLVHAIPLFLDENAA